MTVLQVTVLLWGRGVGGHESRCREPGVWGPGSPNLPLAEFESEDAPGSDPVLTVLPEDSILTMLPESPEVEGLLSGKGQAE